MKRIKHLFIGIDWSKNYCDQSNNDDRTNKQKEVTCEKCLEKHMPDTAKTVFNAI